jgi:hypothetical protein
MPGNGPDGVKHTKFAMTQLKPRHCVPMIEKARDMDKLGVVDLQYCDRVEGSESAPHEGCSVQGGSHWAQEEITGTRQPTCGPVHACRTRHFLGGLC